MYYSYSSLSVNNNFSERTVMLLLEYELIVNTARAGPLLLTMFFTVALNKQTEHWL